jgi:hypothetical protein
MAITVTNGVTQELTAAQLSTAYGAGNIKTPSKDFVFPYKGHHIKFTNGKPKVVDAQLAAALTAAGAPVA